ncbi:MAG: cysteine desulfhydrase [Nocardioidaceae bacterium]|nr:cysteine desulfhydrase [Nocardioidaceae bacterium]
MTDRLLLGTWPTPIEPMPRLTRRLGLAHGSLLVKRDDLTGLGGGGNKVRKLEYLCAEAQTIGADVLVTTGAAQSNHARITSAAAARLGMRCTLVLWGHPPERVVGNLVLDTLAGADLVWVGDGDAAATAEQTVSELAAGGATPYLVPYGGSSPASAQGYVDCAEELLAQVPDLARVYTAVGSGGTMAGLIAGLGTERVVGVDTGAVGDATSTVNGLLAGMGVDASVEVRGDQVGDGYATYGAATRAALEHVARTEGIFLDPIYTGRAAAALVADAETGRLGAGPTVLLHSGGLPGLFGRDDVAPVTSVV